MGFTHLLKTHIFCRVQKRYGRNVSVEKYARYRLYVALCCCCTPVAKFFHPLDFQTARVKRINWKWAITRNGMHKLLNANNELWRERASDMEYKLNNNAILLWVGVPGPRPATAGSLPSGGPRAGRRMGRPRPAPAGPRRREHARSVRARPSCCAAFVDRTANCVPSRSSDVPLPLPVAYHVGTVCRCTDQCS